MQDESMLSNLRVFTDKVYKNMKRLIKETDDHDLRDLKQAFKSHDNKYVHTSTLSFSSQETFLFVAATDQIPDNQLMKHLKR